MPEEKLPRTLRLGLQINNLRKAQTVLTELHEEYKTLALKYGLEHTVTALHNLEFQMGEWLEENRKREAMKK